jgi:small subunit ribosomal protein S8
MVNDIIADSITRIRNSSMRKNDKAVLLYAKVIESLLKILKDDGYIEKYKVVGEGTKKRISVILKYDEDGNSVVNEITRISKPGRRVYKKKDELKSFKNGYGTVIVSTSKGVFANKDAFKMGLGGEALCSVW